MYNGSAETKFKLFTKVIKYGLLDRFPCLVEFKSFFNVVKLKPLPISENSTGGRPRVGTAARVLRMWPST